MDTETYRPRRPARSRFVPLRGLEVHLLEWGDASLVAPERPTLVMAHGWMDIGASFQFVVDAFAQERHVVAFDWRGFGLTRSPTVDSYWFPDYLGDLDALLNSLSPDAPVDLLGHSMGANVAMLYAGVRPHRIRRLINLEGFGLPETRPEQAPRRYAQWLDELGAPMGLRGYATLDEVAARLRQNSPGLTADKARWLASHWAQQDADGRWQILGDPAHKRVNPQLYRKDEALACWKLIEAPVLWVEGQLTNLAKWWGARYPRADFDARIDVVPKLERVRLADCGHMLHHEQPEALAAAIESFLGPQPGAA
jgi:pimeloyl-ACP methyl ester carboxylesterase